MLKLKIGNIQKTGILEKGISTLLIESQFIKGIKHYFSDTRFDLVIYSTPPITFEKVVKYIVKRDDARTYLLLKDIFPQNAVDMGMLSKSGLKGILYRYFRKKEKKLYQISDKIGCMSSANVEYIIKHNPEIPQDKVEVCPNSVDVIDKRVDDETRNLIRKKYAIPEDKRVFVYGGNLGKPQGIPFVIECLKKCRDMNDVFFLIVGDGTEYGIVEKYINEEKPTNVKLLRLLPKDDYDTMLGACDVGLIFLDYRFTIPNFPSRLLSYMQAGLPVLACTDAVTDLGMMLEQANCGWKCFSNDVREFDEAVGRAIIADRNQMGKNAYCYVKNHFTSEISFQIIMKNFMDWNDVKRNSI